MTDQNFTIPQDIREGYSVFKSFFLELTDTMQIEAQEWIDELKSTIKRWKEGGPEPDWNSFRESANEICHEDGMPSLFEEE